MYQSQNAFLYLYLVVLTNIQDDRVEVVLRYQNSCRPVENERELGLYDKTIGVSDKAGALA